MNDKPAFDPSQPFQPVADKPAFDPSKPFEAAPAEKPSVAMDVAKAVPVGLAKGAIGLPGLPGDLQSMGNALIDKIMLGAGHTVMDWTGYGPQSGTPERDKFDKIYQAIGSGSNIPTSGDMQKGVEKVTGPFYKPQTTPGKYAGAIAENAPSALLIGGGGALARTANVVVPAVASEGAGQATEGSKFEPLMRFLGGLFGNAGTAIVQARAGAPERMVREATRGTTPAEFDAAQRLHQTGADIGVPLSGPEAIQAATNGATRLGDVQRVVEGSAGGGTNTARFYSERPGQVHAATGRTLDTIAPQSAQPDTLGPRVAEAATGELDAVRQNINTATRPAYQAAEQHVMAPVDFDPIARDPAFQASLRRLRADEVLAPTYANMPDNSVAVIDAVTKDMRSRGVALNNAANPGFQPQAAAMYTGGSAEARDIARTPARGGLQAYDDALVAQEQARRQNLEPLEQGPLGRLAEAGDTRTAANTVLPAKPLTGGDRAIVDAITRVDNRDPGAGSGIVRQALADRYDATAGRLISGENQYGGAKFAKDVAGTPQAEANLNGVTDALRVGPFPAGGAPPSDLQNLVEVLRATGMRKPQGSATAFNQQTAQDLQKAPLVAEAAMAAKSGGLSIPTGIRDRAKSAWLGRGTSALSDMFLAPDSVQQIREISARAAQTPMSDAMLRQITQTPNEAVIR